MKRPAALTLIILTAPLAFAQQSSSSPCVAPATTTIDVATIKPSQVAADSSRGGGSADSVTTSGTILSMIQFAWDLRSFQVTGGPGWNGTDTWDVVAKVDQPSPDWAKFSNDNRRAIRQQRVQAVLMHRFALECHFETKEFPVYNLVLAKGGTKLQPAANAAKRPSLDWDGDRENRMAGTSVNLTAVTRDLSLVLGRTVIDKTGLTGIYDFKLTWTSQRDAGSSASADDSASGPTIFTALEEQLGLKLESAKGPVPVLVIDHIERPSEN